MDDDEPISMGLDEEGRETFVVRHVAAVVEPTDVHTRLTLRRIEGIVTDQSRVNRLILAALACVVIALCVTVGVIYAQGDQLDRIEFILDNYLEQR
jgi:hypothetical protein